LDALGMLFLCITSFLFLMASIYSMAYLIREGKRKHHKKGFEEDDIFQDAPEAVFIGCLLFFLGSMTLVTMSQHFGVLWVAMELTTLVTAPLIYFHRHHRSLEATWKYLLICSVGIALALLGNLFLAIAGSDMAELGRKDVPLFINKLIQNGGNLSIPWLKAAFLFFLVGYGTKMGLAPFHTWLPDAHSEAPSVVSALLSGALLNCAFLSILRIHQVSISAGLAYFSEQLLLLFGLVSILFASFFILGQTDYKRMLAYSSIEHMGILAMGVGLGGAAIFGAMFHAINHSFIKALLFFTAGNILSVYRTKSVNDVEGVLKEMPVSGFLWLLGFLAINGSPPFGAFVSEFIILKSALDQGHYYIAAFYLAVLAIIFLGMGIIVLHMVGGKTKIVFETSRKQESFYAMLPA